MPIEIDDSTFDDRILRAREPVLVVFGAQWCGPCKRFTPLVEKVGDELALTVAKIDVDRAPQAAARYGVRAAPTLLLFCDGVVIAHNVGTMPEHALRSFAATGCAPRCTPSAAGR